MKNLILLFFTSYLFFSPLQAQVNEQEGNIANEFIKNQVDTQANFPFLGRSRTPRNTSFYSKNMWDYDGSKKWYGIEYTKKDVSLFGLENRIKTSGKVIVYDASVTSITDNVILEKSGILVNTNNVFVNTTDKTLLIPIMYQGGKVNFTPAEKIKISEYVNKSLSFSGSTPAKITISSKDGDFNIEISKSEFTNEDVLIRGFDLRSRTEKKTAIKEINQLFDAGRLEGIESRLDDIINKYPEIDEFYTLREKFQAIDFVSKINQRNNDVQLRYVDDRSERFSVFDGLSPKNEYKITNKQEFIKELLNSVNENTRCIYLDVKGINEAKVEAFLRTTKIRINKERPNLRVELVPTDAVEKNLFFNSTVLDQVNNSKIQYGLYGENSGTQSYNVKANGKTWKVGIGLRINSTIAKVKANKYINSFFKIFGKTTKKKPWKLSDAVNDTRKNLEKKHKDLKPKDYDCLFNKEFGTMNIVFIEEIVTEQTLSNGEE